MKPNPNRKPRWGSRPFRAPKALEGDFKKAVLDYLEWEGIWRMNVVSGATRIGTQATQAKDGSWSYTGGQWAKLADKGTPDILVMIPADRAVRNFLTGEIETCHYSRIGWIETKQKGEKLRPEQKKFAERCQRDGALFWKLDNAADLRRAIPPKMELFTDPALRAGAVVPREPVPSETSAPPAEADPYACPPDAFECPAPLSDTPDSPLLPSSGQ